MRRWPPGRWTHGTALAGVVVGAVLLRLWLLTTPALTLEADEAVTGIMARGILDGHHRAYYAGQNYMGSLEQYLQSAVLALAPPHDIVLRLPQVVLAAAACILVHQLAVATGLGRRRAVLAAGMFAAGPYFLAYWGAKSRGGYSAAMVLALLGLLVALRTHPARESNRVAAVAFGFICGLAFWTNQQAAIVLAPTAWWLWAVLRVRPGRHAALLGAGFTVGALPAVWHTAASGVTPFATGAGESTLSERFRHLVSATVPDFLGARDDGEPLVSLPPPTLVGGLVLAVLAVLAVRRRHALGRFVRLQAQQRQPLDLLIAVLVTAPLVLLASGTSTEATARFVFVVYPVVAVLAASAPVPAVIHRRPILGVLPVVLLLAHTVVGARWLIAADDGGHETFTGAVVRSEDVEAVLAALRSADVSTAYADYWLAQPLTWASGGDVLVEPIYQRRFEHVSRAVARDPRPALVVSDREVADLRRALADSGLDGRFLRAGEWWVVTGPAIQAPLPEAPTIADAIATRA